MNEYVNCYVGVLLHSVSERMCLMCVKSGEFSLGIDFSRRSLALSPPVYLNVHV